MNTIISKPKGREMTPSCLRGRAENEDRVCESTYRHDLGENRSGTPKFALDINNNRAFSATSNIQVDSRPSNIPFHENLTSLSHCDGKIENIDFLKNPMNNMIESSHTCSNHHFIKNRALPFDYVRSPNVIYNQISPNPAKQQDLPGENVEEVHAEEICSSFIGRSAHQSNLNQLPGSFNREESLTDLDRGPNCAEFADRQTAEKYPGTNQKTRIQEATIDPMTCCASPTRATDNKMDHVMHSSLSTNPSVQNEEKTTPRETVRPTFHPKEFGHLIPIESHAHTPQSMLEVEPGVETEGTLLKANMEREMVNIVSRNTTKEASMDRELEPNLAIPEDLENGSKFNLSTAEVAERDRILHYRSLSSGDLTDLAANRGRSSLTFRIKKPEYRRDKIANTPSTAETINLTAKSPVSLAKEITTELVDRNSQPLPPGLLMKLTKNLHEACDKILKRMKEVSCAGRRGSGNLGGPLTRNQDEDFLKVDIPPRRNEASTFCHRPMLYVFVIRIIHEAPENQSQNNYQEDNAMAEQEPGACYFIMMQGISESEVQSRLKLLQEDFHSFFPSYRGWKYGKRAAKRVEFYTISGSQTRELQRVCSIDVRGTDYGQCHVFESKIQETPQFVEVMQPRPGIISDIASDPPGQQSQYIPPGDHRREAYRLSTFECFPRQTPVNASGLAKYGFVYTGFYDRVKCYSCGRTVEKWAPGDDPSDKRWHKQDCLLARGVMNDNIPIGGIFSSALFNASSSGPSTSSVPQPMEVGHSHNQNFNAAMPRGVDVGDLTRSGGTYQMLPNSTFVIGPTSVQTHRAPFPRQPATNPPATRNPPRQWRMANVISADHKRHLTNLYLNRELDRLASFGRWPTGRPNVAPLELARAGFFYLGDMDRTQCYSCGGVLRNWSVDDDAMAEHRTHFPNCRIIAGVERRNVPIPQQPETPMELAQKFPCRFPMNPHMRSEQSRLATFDRRWPIDRTRAQPQEIAEAGFFFLGERDRVKCWYCNGGLQNWEYDDVPWIEHAKWFPNCQFLLAKQGQLFVYRYLSLSPHLPRPIIGRQDGSTVDPSTASLHSGQTSGSQDVAPAPAAPRAQAPSPPPAIIDPQEELRKRRERVEKDLKEKDAVKVVLAMGYEENLVRRTLLDKLEAGGAHDANNIFEGTAALLDAVIEKEREIEREAEEEQATSIKFPTISSVYSGLTVGSMDTSPSGPPSGVHLVSGFDDEDEDRDLYSSIAEGPSTGAVGGATSGPASSGNENLQHILKNIPDDQESIKEFIEQKKEERLCKICFTETADMVFIPCSHMCCCMSCTEAIRHCPICRKKIEKAIKTYIK